MTFDITPYRALYPFASHYLNRNGLQYHYIDEGQGDSIIMLHGNPTWSFYFRSLVKDLAPDHRVIVPDHIGCGLSDKPKDCDYEYRLKSRVDDLEALLEHIGARENLTLVVHDWGGMIGMAYAVRHPERIKRLVIMNTAAFLMPAGKKLPWRLWMIRQILPFATIAVRGFNLFAGFATFMASYKGLSKMVKRGLTAPYNSWQNRIATLRFVQDIPMYKGDPSYDQAEFVDQNVQALFAHTPMLICWGMHDFVFDKDYLTEWQRRFPDAQTHAFANAGHYVLEDCPDEIVPLVRNFLQKHSI